MMQPDTVKLLLSEYDRLKALECERLKGYENSTQWYLTVISAAGGAIILLMDKQATSPTLPLYLAVVAGLALCIGVITFLRLLGLDVAIADYAHGRYLIRKKFEAADAELTTAFPALLVEDRAKFTSWASFRGIMQRALTISQQKTMVGMINCIISACLAIIIAWPETVIGALVVGASAAILAGALHVCYSSWRYNLAYTPPDSRETTYERQAISPASGGSSDP